MHKRRLQRHKIELYSRLRCLKTKLSSYSGGSQSVFPGPAASVSLGNLRDVHILRPHARAAESETLGARPRNVHFVSPLGQGWAYAGPTAR